MPTSSTTSPRSRCSARSRREARRRPPSRRSPSQTEVVDKLKSGLNGMKEKLGQLQVKRSELLARAKTAEAQNKVQDAVKSIDVLDPTSELGRFEDKVRRQEALGAGKQELAASSLDAQFNEPRRPRRADRGRRAPRRAEGRRLVAGCDLGLSRHTTHGCRGSRRAAASARPGHSPTSSPGPLGGCEAGIQRRGGSVPV